MRRHCGGVCWSDGGHGGQCSSGHGRSPKNASANSGGAIFREHRSVRALIETRAQSPRPCGDNLIYFEWRHCREVINVELALRAVADSVGPRHVVPIGQARVGDSEDGHIVRVLPTNRQRNQRGAKSCLPRRSTFRMIWHGSYGHVKMTMIS